MNNEIQLNPLNAHVFGDLENFQVYCQEPNRLVKNKIFINLITEITHVVNHVHALMNTFSADNTITHVLY